MVLTIKKGDLLSIKKGIIAHGCNSKGVMGAGLAKDIKEMYPVVYEIYRKSKLVVGEIIPVYLEKDFIVVNCITQNNYGYKKGYDYIAIHSCLKKLGDLAKSSNLDLHFPLIGSGLAGGDKDTIIKIMKNIFDNSGGNTLGSDYHSVNATLWLL